MTQDQLAQLHTQRVAANTKGLLAEVFTDNIELRSRLDVAETAQAALQVQVDSLTAELAKQPAPAAEPAA